MNMSQVKFRVECIGSKGCDWLVNDGLEVSEDAIGDHDGRSALRV